MTSTLICPSVIAKILHITRSSWALAVQDLPGPTAVMSLCDASTPVPKQALRSDKAPVFQVPQGFDLLRPTGWSAHQRIATLLRDWENREHLASCDMPHA